MFTVGLKAAKHMMELAKGLWRFVWHCGYVSLRRFAAGLFGSVSLEATATFDLTANGAGVSPQQGSNLGGGVLGSHKALDLVSFFSAEVFVHWATSTWRLKRP